MSEEIQQPQNQVEIKVKNDSSSSALLVANPIPSIEKATTTSGRPRLAQSPAGALLVEVSGKSLQPSVASDSVVREYCQFLVDQLQRKKKEGAGEVSEEEALVLLNAASTVDRKAWDKSLVDSVRDVLEHHPSLRNNNLLQSLTSQTLGKLPTFPSQRDVNTMNSLNNNNSSSSTNNAIGVNNNNSVINADNLHGISGRLPQSSDDHVSHVLIDLGPSCTRSLQTFRGVLQELGTVTEISLARLLFFLAQQSVSSQQQQQQESESAGLSSALLSSLLPGGSQGGNGSFGAEWNLAVVAQVLCEDYASLSWNAVVESFDFPGFGFSDTQQFRTLLDLYRAGAGGTPPLQALTKHWRNTSGQLSVFECMLAVPPSVFLVPLDEEELADAATAPQTCPLPNPQCWASLLILNRLLYLSDVPSLFRRVRDLFVKCLLNCPEVLLCSLVRLQLRVTSGNEPHNNNNNAGLQLKQDVMRELIPLFFRPQVHRRVQNGPAALRRLYAISPHTVVAACLEAWRSTAAEGPSVRLQSILHIINIARLLPSPTEAVGSLLSGKDIEFSLAMAFVMADHDYLQLKVWLTEKFKGGPSVTPTAIALINWIRLQYQSAGPRADLSKGQSAAPLVSLENLVTSLSLLRELDPAVLAQSQGDRTLGQVVAALTEAVVQAFPSLRPNFVAVSAPGVTTSGGSVASINSVAAQSTGSSASARSPSPGGASDDVEEMATQYFQNIYTSRQSIGEIVEMLKRFKTSGNSKENEIFACMVHNLFDEYRFFSKYPEKELRITGILFGALIQEQLVSSITLGIALRYVLEALRKPPSPPNTTTSSGKMFKFGMFALEQFKGRLHEWPQYCSHIVQIPHLKEKYSKLVAEIEQEMLKSNQIRARTGGGTPSTGANSPASTNRSGSTTPTSLELPKPRVAEFGPNLGRAVTDLAEAYDESDIAAPPDAILDRVQFMINNMAPSNVEQKAQELKDMLDQTYFGWLGQFLVVKRISTQANFHSLYLSFLDYLGEYGKGLVEAILKSAYHNIGKLLRSPKITTSSSERSYLKNLGIWLGQITLARNRPILQIMLDCKELLLQGYETGKLIAVAPFLAKTLEGAKGSVVFRPPNPWLMGILGVFRSVYNVEGLKMNIKFEVEVLCKNLGIKLEDIPLRNEVLAMRIAPTKERNPDFNIRSASVASSQPAAAKSSTPIRAAGSSPDGQSTALSTSSVASAPAAASGTSDERPRKEAATQPEGSGTVIPNLAAYVTVNPSLPQLLQSQGGGALANLSMAALKRCVPIAVDKAIREIIQPVVERSVTIACITTKEIVTKDFAMESDEMKMRKAGQLMVANLAGSLALVTCREPLRSSVSQHLRRLLTETIASSKMNDQEQNIIEQCVQICATDNLELGCMLIEKAATEKAVKDVDETLAGPMNARRTHREQTGQPFYDMSIFAGGNQRYPAALPEQLQPKPGGLRPAHFQLYESFQRMARPSQGLGPMGSSSSPTASNVPGPNGMPSSNRSLSAGEVGGEQDGGIGVGGKEAGARPQSSADTLSQVASKLDAAVSALLSAAGSRAPEVKLSMLSADHQIRQLLGLVKQIMPNAGPSGNIARPLTTTEQDMVLGFSQGIFKRLYELSLAEPLRLETLVALLESINSFCPKLGKDMGTWATYAPTNTEPQRRLHRTVLLLLVRSRLLAVPELDNFLAARTDNGRSHIWVEFSLLFIRTAFMERISTPSDFPKLIDLMTRIVEGKSQATPQIVQAYRKPILRMLEETGTRLPAVVEPVPNVSQHQPSTPTSAAARLPQSFSFEEGSSLSPASLATLMQASRKVAETTEASMRNDPPNARHQVAALLDGWIRIQTDPNSSEKNLAQYLQVLQQMGVGKVEESTERFLRLSTIVVIDAVLKSSTQAADGSKTLNHSFVDMYTRLLVILFRHMNTGGVPEQVAAQRLGVLNKILGSIVRSMMWHFEKKKVERASWDQRPWFRLLMNLVMDINKPDPAFESIRLGILSVFGSAFHVSQPLVMPGFAFAWLELVSHRHFLPNIMLFPGEKGWHIAHQLLIDHFLFLEPYLSRVELTPPIKKLYEGTLRVLLVLLHDFPSFLSGYHISFCNVVPHNCVQLRNIILSATPKGMNPPDPFTPNLKIDLLSDIARSPTILSNVLGPIESIRGHLDAYLKDGQRSNFLNGLLPFLYKEGTSEIHVGKVNSLVLYVGAHAIARLHSAQFTLTRTPEMEVFQRLMELDDKGRYTCLNAVANQLRFPSSHTHYFSCVMLYLFSESKSVVVKEQVTRVLLERLIVNRPHPWGLLITFIELIKNQRYGFWTYPFTRCATEIEKVFESVARSCMQPNAQRGALVGGDDQ
ncbi:hypothetical protein ACA910_001471 [Epithemia clementina (nom. ined.)]